MMWANGPTPLYPPSPRPKGPWGGGIKEIPQGTKTKNQIWREQ